MSYRKSVDWEKVALDLWRLLDDIDTLDDACKDNDASFRKHVYAVQQKRHAILDPSEWEARIAQYEPHDETEAAREALAKDAARHARKALIINIWTFCE